MADQLYIKSGCTVKGNAVYKNGVVIFEQQAQDVTTFLSSVYKHLDINYPKFYKMDSLCKLGFLASEIVLKDNFDKMLYKTEDVGLILSTANSSLDADIKYWESAQEVASPALFVYTLPNIVIGEICIRNGFKGEHALYITAQFDPAFIHQQVKYLFDNDVIQTCICGWLDVLEDNFTAAFYLVERKESGVTFSAAKLSI